MRTRQRVAIRRRLTPRAVLSVSILLALCALSPAEALAQSATTARVLFREARELMKKERYAEACPKLEESLRLDSGMGTQFNLAHCWEMIGRNASAWGLFLDVAAQAKTQGQRRRATAARQRAEALEPNLSRLQLEVLNPTPDQSVTLGGVTIGPAVWDTALPVDPGIQRIEAMAEGRETWKREVEVKEPGQTVSVTIPELADLAPEEPVQVEAVATPADATTPPESDLTKPGLGAGRLAAGIGLAVLGAGGAVTGVLFAMKNASETDAALGLCVGEDPTTGAQVVCNRDRDSLSYDSGAAEQRERENHRKSAEQATLISALGFAVGGAALIGSIIVFATASGDERPEVDTASGLSPELSVAPGWVGASLSGRF